MAILRQYWHTHRYLDPLLTLSLHRVKVRYKQSMLGIAWAIVQPLALMLIYTVIFSVVTKMPGNDQAYPVFVFSALLPWIFFNGTLTSTANSLVAHPCIITKGYFARDILPLTHVIAAMFDFLIASSILALMQIDATIERFGAADPMDWFVGCQILPAQVPFPLKGAFQQPFTISVLSDVAP